MIDQRWMELKVEGKNITGRSYHSALAYKDTLYVYGGYDVQRGIMNDFYSLHLTSQLLEWKTIQLNKNSRLQYPGPRRKHTAVLILNQMIIFGGQFQSTNNTNELNIYEFNTNSWTNHNFKSTEIPPIDGHNSVVLENEMIVFGGFFGGKIGKYSNQVSKFNLSTKKWSILFNNNQEPSSSYPPPRASASAVILHANLYIFGGTNGDSKFNDLWIFMIASGKWTKLAQNSQNLPDYRHGASLSCLGHYLFLFGGIHDITKEKNDLFIFSLKQNDWVINEEPQKIGLQSVLKFEMTIQEKNLGNSISSNQPGSPMKRTSKKNKIHYLKREKMKFYFYKPSLSPQRTPQEMMLLKEIESNQKIVNDSKKKQQLQQKLDFLKQLEVKSEQEKQNLRCVTPVTETLKNSIAIIGNQSKSVNLGESMQLENSSCKIVSSNKYFIGKIPSARDGHSCCTYNGNMIILGGDRHLMSFSDVYEFKMSLAIEQLQKNI